MGFETSLVSWTFTYDRRPGAEPYIIAVGPVAESIPALLALFDRISYRTAL